TRTGKILRKRGVCCRSSVVEHSLGKGEVVCSIHTGSTSKNPRKYGLFAWRSRSRRGWERGGYEAKTRPSDCTNSCTSCGTRWRWGARGQSGTPPRQTDKRRGSGRKFPVAPHRGSVKPGGIQGRVGGHATVPTPHVSPDMKNGPYELVGALEGYPGKSYWGR